MRSYSRQVVSSFLWQGGTQLIGQSLSWLATILVIRMLSPADYGLMAMAGTLMGLFFLFADFGFGAAAVQAKALDKDQLRHLFGAVVATHVGGCVLMIVSAPLVAEFFGEPRLTSLVLVLSANFLLVGAAVIPQAHIIRDMNFPAKARVDVLATIVSAVVALAMAAAGFGVWALVASSLTMHGVRALGYNLLRPIALLPAFSWRAVAGLLQFGALVTADRLLFFFHGQTDVVIGGRVLGTETLGLYVVALTLAAIPMDRMVPVITQVSFAAYSRIQSDAERVRRNVLRSVDLVSLATFPAFLGMAVVAGDFVPAVLGARWLDLVVPFQLLCLVLPMKAVAVLFTPALFGMGRAGVNVLNTAVAFVVMAVAVLVGVRYGVIGMCMAWVAAYPLVFAFTSWRSLRTLGIPYGAFLRRCAFPAWASVTMALAVLGLEGAIGHLASAPVRLAVLVVAGMLVYGGLVFLFQRRTVSDLYAVVRS